MENHRAQAPKFYDAVGESGVSPSWEWGEKKLLQIIPIIPSFESSVDTLWVASHRVGSDLLLANGIINSWYC